MRHGIGAKTIALLILGSLSTGCSLLIADPGIDVKDRPDGGWMLADTPRMWADWQGTVDREVEREVAGLPPSGGGGWNERWMGSIRALRDGHSENPEKYVDYIVHRRRQAGLPELDQSQ